MSRRGKIMVGGAIIMAIGIIIIIGGYNKYLNMAGTFATFANIPPPWAIEITIGSLMAVVGGFIAFFGSCQME